MRENFNFDGVFAFLSAVMSVCAAFGEEARDVFIFVGPPRWCFLSRINPRFEVLL